jgi:hypothetical protein
MQMTCGRPEMNALAAIVFALRGLDPAQFGPSALHNHRPMSLNQLWRHRRTVNRIRDRGVREVVLEPPPYPFRGPQVHIPSRQPKASAACEAHECSGRKPTMRFSSRRSW